MINDGLNFTLSVAFVRDSRHAENFGEKDLSQGSMCHMADQNHSVAKIFPDGMLCNFNHKEQG